MGEPTVNSWLDDTVSIMERKIEIDQECDTFLQSIQTQIAEVRIMQTTKEIKMVALMQKIADNIQGNFQPEVIARLNKELTPQNSLFSSGSPYQK